jgi:hypothetical protein
MPMRSLIVAAMLQKTFSLGNPDAMPMRSLIVAAMLAGADSASIDSCLKNSDQTYVGCAFGKDGLRALDCKFTVGSCGSIPGEDTHCSGGADCDLAPWACCHECGGSWCLPRPFDPTGNCTFNPDDSYVGCAYGHDGQPAKSCNRTDIGSCGSVPGDGNYCGGGDKCEQGQEAQCCSDCGGLWCPPRVDPAARHVVDETTLAQRQAARKAAANKAMVAADARRRKVSRE